MHRAPRMHLTLHAASRSLSLAGKPFAAMLGPSMTGGDAGWLPRGPVRLLMATNVTMFSAITHPIATVCTHAAQRAATRTHAHAHAQTQTHTDSDTINTATHARKRAGAHARIGQARMHACTNGRTNTRMRALAHTHRTPKPMAARAAAQQARTSCK